MATTKKLLVRFNPSKKNPVSGDFLVPRIEERKTELRGIKSGKIADYGIMVYIGVEISENDLFAKLVDSGVVIENAEETVSRLREYLDNLQTLKIGNVVRVISADGDFGLELVASISSAFKA